METRKITKEKIEAVTVVPGEVKAWDWDDWSSDDIARFEKDENYIPDWLPRPYWIVLADSLKGEVFTYRFHFKSEAEANNFATEVRYKGSIDVKRVGISEIYDWEFLSTIYGSSAYEAEEREAHILATSIRKGFIREEDVSNDLI
mgnify:CR=1 FL=1